MSLRILILRGLKFPVPHFHRLSPQNGQITIGRQMILVASQQMPKVRRTRTMKGVPSFCPITGIITASEGASGIKAMKERSVMNDLRDAARHRERCNHALLMVVDAVSAMPP